MKDVVGGAYLKISVEKGVDKSTIMLVAKYGLWITQDRLNIYKYGKPKSNLQSGYRPSGPDKFKRRHDEDVD